MAKTYAELRALSIAELVESYDHLAGSTQLGLGFYREEIARRDAEAATTEIIRMTKTMKSLTWFIAVLTIANIGLVTYSVLAP